MVQSLAILGALVLDLSAARVQDAMELSRIAAAMPAAGRSMTRSLTATMKERRWNTHRDFAAGELSIEFAGARPVRSPGSPLDPRRTAAQAELRTGVTLAVAGDDTVNFTLSARSRKQSGSDQHALRANSIRSLSADVGWHQPGAALSVGIFTDAAKRAVPRYDRLAELVRDPALIASGLRLVGSVAPVERPLSFVIDARLQRVAVADAAIRAGGRTDARAGVTGRLRF